MEENRDWPTYEQLFLLFSDKAEMLIKRCAIAFAVLLVVVQLAMQLPAVRHIFSRVEKAEGVPYSPQAGTVRR